MLASSRDALICYRKTPRVDLDRSNHCRKVYQRLSWHRRLSGLQDTRYNHSVTLVSMGKVLKSLETFLSAPESFSPLKPAHPTLHRQHHCALHHAIKRIPSKMGRAFVLLSIKSRKLQVTLTVAGPEQSLLNGSLENTVTLCKIIHTSAKHLVELSKDQNY